MEFQQLLLFFLMYSLSRGQQTYNRECDCAYMKDGKCAYTLLLPTSVSTDTCSVGSMNQRVEYLERNVSQLQTWSGEQAKYLAQLQSTIIQHQFSIQMLEISQAESAGGTEVSGSTSDCTKCLELQSQIESNLESITSMEIAIAAQGEQLITLTNTFDDIMGNANNMVAKMQVVDTESPDPQQLQGQLEMLQMQVDQMHDRYWLCSKRGLLISGNDIAVGNEYITASSEYDLEHGATLSRIKAINESEQERAWCPGEPNDDEWLQFRLDKSRTVFGIVLRGRFDYEQWVTTYKVKYSDDGVNWTTYTDVIGDEQIFQGSTDQLTAATSLFYQPIKTEYIRIYPLTAYANRNKCMRADVLGCVDNS